jgi:hypothetical protein
MNVYDIVRGADARNPYVAFKGLLWESQIQRWNVSRMLFNARRPDMVASESESLVVITKERSWLRGDENSERIWRRKIHL